MGQLTMRFPNQEVYVGTGTLIDELHVLTCAHNLYSKEDGGWATSVDFVCARNGPHEPYGRVLARRLWIPEEYRTLDAPNPNRSNGYVAEVTQFLYDYGVVSLREPLEAPGSVPLYASPDSKLQKRHIGIWGYPGDKPAGTMWGTEGAPPTTSESLLFYRLATFNGQSGSGVLFRTSTVPKVVGIHVAGDQALGTNFAVRLTEEIIAQIRGQWVGGVDL